MAGNVHRTVRQVTLVVETDGLSDAEHLRRVRWAESNILNANSNVDKAYVGVVISNEDGTDVRHMGSGIPTDETRELIEELRAS